MIETAADAVEPKDAAQMLLIGTSPAMRTLRGLIRLVADSDAPVVLTGPSGTGKEVVAQALHALSARHGNALVPVNCGAIPGELIESELFGHEKGSFTGAITQRRGRFEQADGGTLFLDELGDMPLAMQVKLLRVLEDRRVARIGGTASIAVDTRIVCATHRDLPHEVSAGRFREDLWYRLAVFPIAVPALAERGEDIRLLIAHFLKRCAGLPPQFSDGAIARLMTHDWPGNVRELRNLVARAQIIFAGRTVSADDAATLIGAQPRVAVARVPEQATAPSPGGIDLKTMLGELERRHIVAALGAAHGVVADAARLVGLNRTTFLEKMKRHDVTRGARVTGGGVLAAMH
jgi:sigma-54 dependent transcriptional regulator, flagellar regulatory protein